MKTLNTTITAVALAALLTVSVKAGSCGPGGAHTLDAKEAKVTTAAAKVDKKAQMDIVETAVAAGSFETLVAAIKAAGLVDALKGEGPITVFAPTDEAFARLPEGTIEALLNDKEKLTSVLTYHVVAGAVKAEDVVKLNEAETLNGQSVSIVVKDNVVMIDDATVTATDIYCSNGVIHIIDSVILPEMDKK